MTWTTLTDKQVAELPALEGEDWRDVEAPNNTVFDQDNNRTLSLPQTLTAEETPFIIKRDIDGKKEFFGQEDMGIPEGIGKGLAHFWFADAPQAMAELVKQEADVAAFHKGKVQRSNYGGLLGMSIEAMGAVKDHIFNSFGTEDVIKKMDGLIDANKKLMPLVGFEPEGGGTGKAFYSIANSGGSLLASLGLYGLTKSPASATLFLGAMQKSSTYQEYVASKKAKGETPNPDEGANIANIDAMAMMPLEYLSFGWLGKAVKGNSAVQKFVRGMAGMTGLTGAALRLGAKGAEGAAIEFVQEGAQAVSNEAVTQTADIRDRSLQVAAEDILAQAAVGAIIGGTAAVTAGAFVEQEAIKKGISKPAAKKMREYTEQNIAAVRTNMSEFIDKELAPIAKDDKSAQAFMSLMQKFENNETLVDREKLDPEARAVFDQYIELFNRSVTDKTGVAAAEKSFYDRAIAAGVTEEEAVAASKLVGARADAASRALGVTPQEWLDSLKLDISVEGVKKAGLAEAEQVKASLAQKPRTFNRKDPSQVQRRLGMEKKPMGVLQFIRSKGGISLGMTKMELDNVKAARKSKGKSASKASMASEEITRLFDGQKGKLGHILNEKGLDLDQLHQLLMDAGYLETKADAYQHQDQTDIQDVLDLIQKELNTGTVYTLAVEQALAQNEDTNIQNQDFLDSIGITPEMSEEEIATELERYRKGDEGYRDSKPKSENSLAEVEDILFQGGEKSLQEQQFINMGRSEATILTPAIKDILTKIGIDFSSMTKEEHSGLGGKVTMLANENLQQILPQGKTEVYHSTSLKSARSLTQRLMSGLKRQDNIYVSPDIELALGQQGNTVTLVLEPTRVLGNLANNLKNQVKPGSEYVVTLTRSKSLKSIIVKNEKTLEALSKEKHLEKNFDFSNAKKTDEGYRIERKETLQQEERGSVTFSKEGILINLMKGRNASTLLHELGHIFLRDMRSAAKSTNRARVKADYEAVKKWLGAKGDTLTVKQEEKFARGFEQYLREGKAPKPELQSIFDTFKKWLTSIYKSAKSLNVEISPEIRTVFDRMLGGDFVQSETLNQEQAARDTEAEYEANRQRVKGTGGTFKTDAGAVASDNWEWFSDTLTPVSSRLGRIHQKLKHAIRRFAYDVGLNSHEDRVKIKPFMDKVAGMETDDRIDLDLALKNRDIDRVDALADKYDMAEEWAAVREVLDEIYTEAHTVGLDINYIEEYFPRQVKKNMAGEYMAFMRGREEWSEIQIALNAADPDHAMNLEEQAAFVNSYLRGFTSNVINMSRPSFTKERTVDFVTADFNRFYEDSMPTLISYVGGMRHGIELRRLFGKSEKETDANIGKYVLSLVKEGTITHQQEDEMKKIFKAVANTKGTHGWVGWAKNVSYIYTMGSPISAITQIQDLAFSFYENGIWRTSKAFVNSITGTQMLKKEDLGLENIIQEYADETRAAKMVRKTFRLVGISGMDNIGKEVFIQASFDRIRAAAEQGGDAFNAEMETIFGDRAEQVKADILAKNLTRDVKYLLFSELSDVQPISVAEMPVNHSRGGNWQIMYMLKTYTIKQFDIYRRECFDHIRSGEPARVAKGFGNLVHLSIALMLMGMGTDELKNLLLGRDVEPEQLVIDNIIRLFGVSKYTIYKGRTEGLNSAVWSVIAPPVLALPSDLLMDAIKIAEGDRDPKDAQTLSHVPLIGKFYYWWYGGGSEKK